MDSCAGADVAAMKVWVQGSDAHCDELLVVPGIATERHPFDEAHLYGGVLAPQTCTGKIRNPGEVSGPLPCRQARGPAFDRCGSTYLGPRNQVNDLVFVEAIHHAHINLDWVVAGFDCCVDSAHHTIQTLASGNELVPVRAHGSLQYTMCCYPACIEAPPV
jgi:hypothetical protein